MSRSTLPIYMLATSPQKSCGFSEMKSGPGLNPHSTSAASRIAVVPDPGIPSVSSGTSAPGLVIVRAFGRSDAFDHAGAERLAASGERLFDAIGNERRDGRARARQDADQEADHRAVHECEAAIAQVLHGWQQVSQPLRHR